MGVGVAFISDLHLGHRTILKHTAETPGAYRGGTTVAEHDAWVLSRLQALKPDKRTVWWVLGDVAMAEDRLALLDQVAGRKILVLGNHDVFPTAVYLKHFERVVGIVKKYDLWISHAPVHEVELRGHPNVHGHSHDHALRADGRYLNVSIEWLLAGLPLTLEQVRARLQGIVLQQGGAR